MGQRTEPCSEETGIMFELELLVTTDCFLLTKKFLTKVLSDTIAVEFLEQSFCFCLILASFNFLKIMLYLRHMEKVVP